MIITQIEKVKKNRYKIYVDDEYWYIIDMEIVVDCHLQVGMSCDQDFLDEVKHKADVRKARERALYLLSFRDHSRRELVNKLCRSVDEEVAEQTADRMQELGYLDDYAYGEKLAHHFLEVKKQGMRKALYSMMQKGIPKEMAQEILEAADVDPIEQMTSLVESKYVRYLTDEKGIKKVRDALMRLGYTYSDIREVLDEYIERDTDNYYN